LKLLRFVLPALTRLGRRFRLATMSNGNADLAAIGLAKFFETSLCAREIGALKPAINDRSG
jgi:FMN hydrolase / 5-amino-6-(5-phospho-D-ribitylamino)uracil phosphatase